MTAILIDDEPYALRYLEFLCSGLSEVEIVGRFENALQALCYLSAHETDLVLTDIEMPGLNGVHAVEEIRKIRPETGIIFVTGYEQYALEAFRLDAVSYIMKPCAVEDLQKAVARASKLLPQKRRVRVCTFGAFHLLIDGVPLHMSNSKAQELLALLVDRQGAPVSMAEATDLLWEGRPYDETVKRLYRKAVGYLNQVFKEKDVDFFVSGRGSCHILPTKIDCDYYRLLQGSREAAGHYDGEYMSQYSWAETTNGKIGRLLARSE